MIKRMPTKNFTQNIGHKRKQSERIQSTSHKKPKIADETNEKIMKELKKVNE